MQIFSVIFSINFLALVDPVVEVDLEHSSGSRMSPLLPPGFCFSVPVSVFGQSVLATLLRVSQSHFEAPSGPFREGSNAGPTHLGEGKMKLFA